ncbi:HWE histidine kinase domain-containing protein [Phenylobacterium sp.]|jgi:PAS domain S-box-containing protein|uniref:HWE histidine kinase domain-containing protein n=1 Tax=Phenylobacterium sp. TaxID=1871053 RepID=UPI00378402AC
MSTADAVTDPTLSPSTDRTRDLEARLAALELALAEESRRADALNRIAAAIGAGGDLEGVVQAVVDGGVELTGAQFGAFFYNLVDAGGESYTLYALSGAPRSAFERFPMPRNTALFHPTFVGEGVVRSDDITKDPRYGLSAPYHGMPQGHLPVCSYLAASVVSHSGEVLGGLFFGHSQPAHFPARLEPLMEGLAAQAAVAIDNVRLNASARRDLEERLRAEEALADSQARLEPARERLQFALESGRLGSWELDVETRAYDASELCRANYGRKPDEPFGFEDLVASIHPDDRPRMLAAMETAIRTGGDYDIEYRVIHPSGETRWVQARGRAAQVAGAGGVRRMAGVSLDVTERKRAEERQRLLLNELNHRVKNTLATVQSIASQTLRSAADAAAFRAAFEARLLALSQTHNLLTDAGWEAASLIDILRLEMTPHAAGKPGEARFLIDADRDVRLTPKAAVALGMAFHELATNAVKYGALSTPTGRVSVRSRVMLSDAGHRLIVEWTESGGPPVTKPHRRGFGGRLLEQGLAGELRGEVKLDYRPEGLFCRIELPMQGLEPTE